MNEMGAGVGGKELNALFERRVQCGNGHGDFGGGRQSCPRGETEPRLRRQPPRLLRGHRYVPSARARAASAPRHGRRHYRDDVPASEALSAWSYRWVYFNCILMILFICNNKPQCTSNKHAVNNKHNNNNAPPGSMLSAWSRLYMPPPGNNPTSTTTKSRQQQTQQ